MEKGIPAEDVKRLFTGIELVSLDEDRIRSEVVDRLHEQLTGIDPEHSLELLLYWVYRVSERRQRVEHKDVIEKVERVGKYLSERSHHHKEWFTSITPISETPLSQSKVNELREEFYKGVTARYEHILAGLDFRREQKLSDISRAFERSKIAIIHGASGQGKTTLALRYLHEFYPDLWRFSIHAIEDRQHALSIAAALAGHAAAIRAPMAVFIDVSPKDNSWPDLVNQLGRLSNVHVLVSIREEDFRRATLPTSIEFAEVELTFNEAEARPIYDRAIRAGGGSTYLTFEDAWDAFGTKGPLMEFVYLLTQAQSLRVRLREQVKRIRKEVREKKLAPDELTFLRLAAVATAFETRVHLPKLVGSLDLPEPSLTVDLFEKEYMIRVSPDRLYIDALHPIRSRLLSEYLSDPAIFAWSDSFTRVLPLVREEDLEILLLHALVERPDDRDEILSSIFELKPQTWAGVAGIVRSLLWLGISDYVQSNRDAIERSRELMQDAWFFVVDFNFAGEDGPDMEGWWKTLGDLISKEQRLKIEDTRSRQTPKDTALGPAKEYLEDMQWTPEHPRTTTDWSGAAEVLYWNYRFGISQGVGTWFPKESLISAVQDLPLESLSDLSLAISLSDKNVHSRWITAHHERINARLAREYSVVHLENRNEALVAHFLVRNEHERESVAQEGSADESLHDMAMERVRLVRRLFPNYEKYGSRGYGHLPYAFLQDVDETRKDGVGKEHLPPKWPVKLNGVASGLGRNEYRPKSWGDYIARVISIRRKILECFDGLLGGTTRYLERSTAYNLLSGKPFGTGDWDQCRDLATGLPSLPIVCVDRWGFAQPESSRNDQEDQPEILLRSILDEIYEPYRQAERGLFTSLTGFFIQAMHVATTNFVVGKMPEGSPQQEAALARVEAQGIETDKAFLAMHNLNEAKRALETYQLEFHKLLGHRVEKLALERLEVAEGEVFNSLWQMWLIFTYRPRTNVAPASRRVPQRIEREKDTLVRKIDQAIKGLDPSLGEAEVLRTQPEAESGPALWIRLELADGTNVSAALDGLVPLLADVYAEIDSDSLEYHLCVRSFEHTIVVPTMRGKMINRVAWRMHSLSAISSNTRSALNYLPVQLTDGQLSELDLALWEEGEIALAREVNSALSGFILLAAATSTVADVPRLEGPGLEVTQEFLNERSSELTQLLNTFLSGVEELEEIIKDIPADERSGSPKLSKALMILDELRSRVSPGYPEETSLTMSLDGLGDLAVDLLELTERAEEATTLWIASAIERIETT